MWKGHVLVMAGLLGVLQPVGLHAVIAPQTGNQAHLNQEDQALTPTVEEETAAQQHYEKGKRLLFKQAYDEAIEEFLRALKLHPQWDKALRALSWARKDKKRQEAEGNGRADSLQAMVQKAQDLFEEGQTFEKEGNPIEAAVKYKGALKIIPGYPEALAALDRIQSANQAGLTITTMPAEGDRRTNAPSGRLTTSARRPPLTDRIKAGTSAKSVRRNTSVQGAIQKHYLAGIQAYNNREWGTAITEFELILEFMPSHSKALYYLNQAKKQRQQEIVETKAKAAQAQAQGDAVGEMKALRDMMAMDPSNSEVQAAWARAKKDKQGVVEELYRRGINAYALGHYQQALQIWDLLLDIDPHHKKAKESIKKVREKLELIKD